MFDTLKQLCSLGLSRRKVRVSAGVFGVESVKKRFKLDEGHMPVAYTIEERFPANFVVEEFMLLANQIVGKKLSDECRELAVLR